MCLFFFLQRQLVHIYTAAWQGEQRGVTWVLEVQSGM